MRELKASDLDLKACSKGAISEISVPESFHDTNFVKMFKPDSIEGAKRSLIAYRKMISPVIERVYSISNNFKVEIRSNEVLNNYRENISSWLNSVSFFNNGITRE